MKKIQMNSPKKQKGAVLIVALVILLVLTILGVTLMESSVVEERMAGNLLDRNVTFQAAEAALRAGEEWVDNQVVYPEPVDGASVGDVSVVDTVAGSPSWWNNDDDWWEANTTQYAAGLSGVTTQPYYLVEEYDEVCDNVSDPTISDCKIVYRITSIAWGGRNTTVMLQSLYARRY